MTCGVVQMPWTTRKTNRWVLEQINSETSTEAKMTKVKLSYFRHNVRRRGSLEKTIMSGKIKGKDEDQI